MRPFACTIHSSTLHGISLASQKQDRGASFRLWRIAEVRHPDAQIPGAGPRLMSAAQLWWHFSLLFFAGNPARWHTEPKGGNPPRPLPATVQGLDSGHHSRQPASAFQYSGPPSAGI